LTALFGEVFKYLREVFVTTLLLKIYSCVIYFVMCRNC